MARKDGRRKVTIPDCWGLKLKQSTKGLLIIAEDRHHIVEIDVQWNWITGIICELRSVVHEWRRRTNEMVDEFKEQP